MNTQFIVQFLDKDYSFPLNMGEHGMMGYLTRAAIWPIGDPTPILRKDMMRKSQRKGEKNLTQISRWRANILLDEDEVLHRKPFVLP